MMFILKLSASCQKSQETGTDIVDFRYLVFILPGYNKLKDGQHLQNSNHCYNCYKNKIVDFQLQRKLKVYLKQTKPTRISLFPLQNV